MRLSLETAAGLHRAGKLDEAEAAYREVLSREPHSADALHMLGLVAHQRGRHADAIELISRAVSINPAAAPYHNNLAEAFRATGDAHAALPHFAGAIELRPDYADAHNNLGRALEMLGKPAEARAMYRHAILYEPQHAKARFNLGLVSLLLGDFITGWREYEARWQVPEFAAGHRVPSLPLWDGSDPEGKTILVHCEQGLGDCIQFARYLPLLMGRGAKIILTCPRSLVRLFGSLPETLVVAEGDPTPPADVRVPIASLPLMFETTPATIPTFNAYLRAGANVLGEWRERIRPLRSASQLLVGLAWAGNPAQAEDRWRSLHLEAFAPLGRTLGVQFVSLQKGSPASQRANGLDLIDYSVQFNDLADTAALVAQLDLVIAVDTSVAHLAGALGKPVWTLVRFAADWRWGLGNFTDTAWYPTMRLFRQQTRGDWSPVIDDVAESLRQSTPARQSVAA